MNIEYTEKGKFVDETTELLEELDADAVMIFVFGSRTKGSGCCCEMVADDPQRLAGAIVECLRDMADSMERDIKAKKGVYYGHSDGHKQTEQ